MKKFLLSLIYVSLLALLSSCVVEEGTIDLALDPADMAPTATPTPTPTPTPAITVESVALSVATTSLLWNDEIQMTLTATLSDSTEQDVTTLAEWSVDDALMGGVDNTTTKGLVTSLATSGALIVTANYEGQSDSETFTITALPSEEFTTSGTYTVPANVTSIYVSAVAAGGGGGGGGGGGSSGYGSGGGGGGASGESVQRSSIAVTPEENITVIIGASGPGGTGGGSGVAGTSGTAGADLFFGGYLTLLGGSPGAGGGTWNGMGGAGGSAVGDAPGGGGGNWTPPWAGTAGGDFSSFFGGGAGAAGGDCGGYRNGGSGGGGGASLFSDGGDGGAGTIGNCTGPGFSADPVPTLSATAYGAGGGGGGGGSGGTSAGGTGADGADGGSGYLLIEYE